MKITYLKLVGFKPFVLNYIETVEINFNNAICLILGTNGCGKSSLLKELTPLPPTANDYTDKGEKIIRLEFNHSIYEFKSLTKKNRHSATKNGVSLYENATISSHKEFIIKEFNYTPLVHKVLTGELKFTEMSPLQRRELLMIISPLDLNYVIKFHLKIKEELRDIVGVNKHLVKKKTDLIYKLNSFVIPKSLEEDKNQLENQLNKLIPYLSQKIKQSTTIYQELSEQINKLNQLAGVCKKFKPNYVLKENITSVNELNLYIGECIGKKEQIQSHIFKLSSQIEQLTLITSAIQDETLTIEELKQYYKTTQTKIKENPLSLPATVSVTNIKESIQKLEDSLYLTIGKLPSSFALTEKQFLQIVSLKNKITNKITQLKNDIAILQEKKHHYANEHNILTCPNCKYLFTIKGQNVKTVLNKINNSLIKTNSKLTHLENRVNRYRDFFSDCITFKQYVNFLLNVKTNSSLPFEFWNIVNNEYDLVNYRYRLLTHCSLWKTKITNKERYDNLNKELKQYQEAIDFYYQNGFTSSHQIHLITAQLNELVSEKLMLESIIKESNTLLKKINYYTELETKGRQLIVTIKQTFEELTQSLIVEDAKKRSQFVYTELGNYNSLLQNVKEVTNQLTDIEEEYNAITEKQQLLTLLEENLSPVKGLIAEQMLGFLHSYTEEINKILKKLWEYDLTIMPPRMEDGNINYYFPLLVVNELISDISVGSTGQQDVINLAFMLIMREYLGLTQYPLFMDEIGASFDHEHRSLLLDYVDRLITGKYVQQLFIINHYALMYNKLSCYDTIILDDRSIGVIPETYNEVIVITKKYD